MEKAKNKGVNIILPEDAHIAKIKPDEELTEEVVEQAQNEIVNLYTEKEIEEGKGKNLEGWQILDVGDTTLTKFAEKLDGAKTVVWNGPLGYTEVQKYAHGTETIANYIAKCGAKTVIGGGDSVAAIQKIKKKLNKLQQNVMDAKIYHKMKKLKIKKELQGIRGVKNVAKSISIRCAR